VKKLLIFLVLLGLALAGGAYWLKRSRAPAVREDTFTYAAVERGTLIDSVSATGTLKPRDTVAVGSEQAGKVVEVYVDVNDVVEEGAPLLKVDDQMPRLQLRQAREALTAASADVEKVKAALDAAQRALNRQLELKKGGSGFRTELDRHRAQRDAARAAVTAAEARKLEAATAVERAQLGLDLTVVRVPRFKEPVPSAITLAGKGLREPVALVDRASARRKFVILDRQVVVGQMVGPGVATPLFTLATDLGQMQVHAQVAESDVAHIRKGLPATFTVSAYSENDHPFRGKVTRRGLLSVSQQGAIYYDVVIDVANSVDPETRELRLNPGMTASVDVILREHKGVWKVPTTALNFQLDEYYQSAAAKEKLAQWEKRRDREDWKPLWVWDRQRNRPWPIFVRIGGLKGGQTGIKDSQFNEILEWEAGQEPRSQGPRVIINAPPPRKPGLFDQPTNLKLS
jgi:HlyD family secretion protein